MIYFFYLDGEIDELREEGIFLTEAQQNKTPDHRSARVSTTRKSDTRTLPQEHESASAAEPVTEGNEKHKWDEYLLGILSKPTAQWIVTQRTDPSSKRYKVGLVGISTRVFSLFCLIVNPLHKHA